MYNEGNQRHIVNLLDQGPCFSSGEMMIINDLGACVGIILRLTHCLSEQVEKPIRWLSEKFSKMAAESELR